MRLQPHLSTLFSHSVLTKSSNRGMEKADLFKIQEELVTLWEIHIFILTPSLLFLEIFLFLWLLLTRLRSNHLSSCCIIRLHTTFLHVHLFFVSFCLCTWNASLCSLHFHIGETMKTWHSRWLVPVCRSQTFYLSQILNIWTVFYCNQPS